MPHPKKVGFLPRRENEEAKRTNEIKTAIPLLDSLDIQGKIITADALLTRRGFADYLVLKRKAHYHFTVKANQPALLKDIALFFLDRKEPDHIDNSADHGRIETRKSWITSELNDCLDFPHVGQPFMIERHCIDKKSGKTSRETC